MYKKILILWAYTFLINAAALRDDSAEFKNLMGHALYESSVLPLTLKPFLCTIDCSKSILKASFKPKSNNIIMGEQIIILFNLLAHLATDRLLSSELSTKSMLIEPKLVAEYLGYEKKIADTFSVALILGEMPHVSDISKLENFGTMIQQLKESTPKEAARIINQLVCKVSNGIIITESDITPAQLNLIAVNHFKANWEVPFKEEELGKFKTLDDVKTITYLAGKIRAGYTKSTRGETLSIPLKGTFRYIVFRPAKFDDDLFFDFPSLTGLKDREIFVTLPKLMIESKLNIKKILEGEFRGLSETFLGDKFLDKFLQKSILKTTLKGVEAASISLATLGYSTIPEVNIDSPHFFAIAAPFEDGEYLPLYMGYIGDPTLTGSGVEETTDDGVTLAAAGCAGGGSTVPASS